MHVVSQLSGGNMGGAMGEVLEKGKLKWLAWPSCGRQQLTVKLLDTGLFHLLLYDMHSFTLNVEPRKLYNFNVKDLRNFNVRFPGILLVCAHERAPGAEQPMRQMQPMQPAQHMQQMQPMQQMQMQPMQSGTWRAQLRLLLETICIDM